MMAAAGVLHRDKSEGSGDKLKVIHTIYHTEITLSSYTAVSCLYQCFDDTRPAGVLLVIPNFFLICLKSIAHLEYPAGWMYCISLILKPYMSDLLPC